MKRLIIFFLVLLQFNILSLASDESPNDGSRYEKPISQLLRSRYRPTPTDILKAFNGEIPEINPFMSEKETLGGGPVRGTYQENNATTYSAVKASAKAAAKELAKAIAYLEKAYPNALYFPMGRDAAFFADGLDFFYMSQGETDRVHRLRASGDTVRALNQETGSEFLASNNYAQDVSRPHILIDNTSFSNSSQSRILFNFGIQMFLNAGVNESELYKVMAVAAPGGWNSGWEISSSNRRNESNKKSKYASKVFSIPISKMMYQGGFWHPSSGRDLIALKTGELVGKYEGSFGKDDKRLVLAFTFELMKLVNSEAFLKQVIAHLNALAVKDRFLIEKHIPLRFVEPTPEEKEKIEAARLLDLKLTRESLRKNFRRNLSTLISLRLKPVDLRTAYRPSKQGISSSKILPEAVIADLEKLFVSKLDEIEYSEKVNLNIIDDEISKIIPNLSTTPERLDLLIFLLPELVQTSESSSGFSKNGLTLRDWFNYFNYASYSQVPDLPTYSIFRSLLSAYKSNKISFFDLSMLAEHFYGYERAQNKRVFTKQLDGDPNMLEEFRALLKLWPDTSAYSTNFLKFIRGKLNTKDKKLSCEDLVKAS